MTKKHFFTLLLAVFSQILLAGAAHAQNNTARNNFAERFIIQSVRQIHSAEATYQATAGNGFYGSLADLYATNFIDAATASGEKNGYIFALTKTNSPAKFQLSVTPRSYPKSGRRSFFINEKGDIHAADKNGAVAAESDLIIDDCALYGSIAENERCTILELRTIYNAEQTYLQTVGMGWAYGNLVDLRRAGLIGSVLGSGVVHRYDFVCTNYAAAPNPSFYADAIPENYGVSGYRSFYIGMDGIIRGADHQGGSANQNDPPITD